MQGMLKIGGLGACPLGKIYALRLILVAIYETVKFFTQSKQIKFTLSNSTVYMYVA